MKSLIDRREQVASALERLRAYRKDNSLCRECGEPLEDKDITRCWRCRVKHSTRESILYARRKEERIVA